MNILQNSYKYMVSRTLKMYSLKVHDSSAKIKLNSMEGFDA